MLEREAGYILEKKNMDPVLAETAKNSRKG